MGNVSKKAFDKAVKDFNTLYTGKGYEYVKPALEKAKIEDVVLKNTTQIKVDTYKVNVKARGSMTNGDFTYTKDVVVEYKVRVCNDKDYAISNGLYYLKGDYQGDLMKIFNNALIKLYSTDFSDIGYSLRDIDNSNQYFSHLNRYSKENEEEVGKKETYQILAELNGKKKPLTFYYFTKGEKVLVEKPYKRGDLAKTIIKWIIIGAIVIAGAILVCSYVIPSLTP